MHIRPSTSAFKSQTRKGKLIPVYAEFIADQETPVTLFMKIARLKEKTFLLESAETDEHIGRYSIVGLDPSHEVTLQNNVLQIKQKGLKQKFKITTKEDVFKILRHFIKTLKFVPNPALPSIVGSLVGFLGYEFVQYCEEINLTQKYGTQTADLNLLIARKVIVYDHFNRTVKLIVLADSKNQSANKAYRTACHDLRRLAKCIRTGKAAGERLEAVKKEDYDSFAPNSKVKKKIFLEAVRQIKRYIKNGDCIQTVLSQPFDLGMVQNDFEIYRALRILNPSPYMFYYRNEKLRLIGSSPETLVKKEGMIAETRPIAGTRPRGRDEREDQRLEMQLKSSPKEKAEHLMLVDLGRNDLGRVCHLNTIKVIDFCHVEKFSHVMHLVSVVKGRLKQGKDAFDLIQSAFPAGTVSGAPKIRAMQIIDELEPYRRGPYAGAVGYFGFNGDMDVCITIRTLMIMNRRAMVQAGAGIVNDSNPLREFKETVNKAKALMQAVRLSQRRSS
ncbi:MAG: anthranilate synthase component I [Candidatus Omnitrophica bacterium CG11_big_fil_rev_8_21_14_0_20_45_26]|uniref:Anthranilate synthase component 1 n=1 Tax=Candidatus Abzuiibacterium crystallinum TaxID=1974748 RepID=A0A2H0LS73_9BACT|nr:MAG: anthranilate synthase component I [Candidatus Omnitrophica bacterium CG11_big_fil_rev_8_21_14_0_20_45_26]PIW65021.1 MAG: anthranilate synthase component I [Candidatus Omnitrophica bacterium CG12_big_fil_rev_8_21_14_0_65_45_16]